MLQSKGYTVFGIDDWAHQKYDVIAALNLLDRCDKPMSLLRDIRSSLKTDGRLIVASVIPFSPFVEENKDTNNQPTEKLHIAGQTIEEQINNLVSKIFEPAGFKVERFTRLPYLCEGDLTTSFYVLHDVVFVLRASAGTD